MNIIDYLILLFFLIMIMNYWENYLLKFNNHIYTLIYLNIHLIFRNYLSFSFHFHFLY